MKKIIDGLVNSSLIPSLYIAFFTIYAFLVTSHNIDFNLILINFLGTLVSYNIISFISLRATGIKSARMQWQFDNRILLGFLSTLSAVAILFFIHTLNMSQLLNLAHLGFLILFYEKLTLNTFSFRTKIFLKPLVISYIWTMVAVGNVLFESTNFNWVIFLESLLSITALSLFYDIRAR